MNPLTLRARNYRCFGELDLQLPDGCVAILGENGAGKSSIVNAIDLTIFGARSLADYLSDQADGEELLLELELEHAGELYRIRRTFSARGRGKTTLDFEQADPSASAIVGMGETWRPLTCASTKETQDLIEQTLGLSRETFRASAFLAQGDGAAFTDAQPRDRKRILSQVLGLDRYDHLQERARQDRRTIEAELQTLDGRTATTCDLVEQKSAVVAERDAIVEAETELADTIADLEREHAALSERYQQAREQDARRAAAAAELRETATAVEQLQLRDTQARAAVTLIANARAALAALPATGSIEQLEQRAAQCVAKIEEHRRLIAERDTALAAHRNAVNEQNALIGRARELETNVERLRAEIAAAESGELEHCPTCAQQLGIDARATAIDTLTKRTVAVIDEANALRQQADLIVVSAVPEEPETPERALATLARVNADLATARSNVTQRAQLEERIRQNEQPAAAGPTPDELEVMLDLRATKHQALALLEPVDLDAITRQGASVKQRLETARATLDQQRTLRARLDERLAQIATAQNELALADTTRTDLQGRLDVVVALERAFGRDGIPALIVENSAIPYLETEANRIVGELGTSYRVELHTQAELKSSEGVRDTLDVVVATENGERAYETFSGGERTRINLALRIALARLLAHRRGAESRLLAIDEPDGLDEAGMAALVDVLRNLETDFAKLYVVSHVPGLRDSFDTTLSVVRGGDGWSRIDEADIFEAVPA